MPLIYKDLIYAAIDNAMRGMLPAQSPNLDAETIAESLIPQVFQAVGEAAAADERKRSLLRRSKAISLAAGLATLTADVLTKYIEDATLTDPADLTKRYSWIEFHDFLRNAEVRLGYFTVRGGTDLLVRDPAQLYTEPLVATGARTLVIPCVPERPATADDPIDVPDVIGSDLVEALSEALRVRINRGARIAPTTEMATA